MCGTTNHLVNNKVRTKAVHLRDKLFQHLWAVGHPNHPDFCLNKMDTCLTVYGYTSRNLNTFTKSLALYVQSFIQNLFLFPMFCRDSIVLSVKWSWEFEKLFICKNLLVSDLLLLNVSTLFQNGSHTSLSVLLNFCLFIFWKPCRSKSILASLSTEDQGYQSSQQFPSFYYVYLIEFPGSKSTKPVAHFLLSIAPSCICFLSFCPLHWFHEFSLRGYLKLRVSSFFEESFSSVPLQSPPPLHNPPFICTPWDSVLLFILIKK